MTLIRNFGIGFAILASAMELVGCGGGSGHSGPTIVYYNGYQGYYSGSTFCYYYNDYCNTGLNWGIVGTGTSTGTSTGGTSTGGYSTGGTSTGGYSTGGTSTGGYSTGGTSTGGYSTGGTSTGGYSTGGTSTGGYSSGSSTGTSGGYTDSVGGNSKDVGVINSQVAEQNLDSRAQNMANVFQMDFNSAKQLAQLGDRMNQLMANNNEMTENDRAAFVQAALGVAGITSDQLNSAQALLVNNGDASAVNALIEQGATNLGMPSSAPLREQILPAIGINL